MKLLREVMKNPSGWDSLDNFIGEVPENNLLFVYAQNRDSRRIDCSNFECILKELGGESETVCVIRYGHWACGWIEYIGVLNYTNEHVKALQLLKEIEDYSILNEDHYHELEWNESNDYWLSLSIAERIELCKEYGLSIFSARRGYIPDNDGSLDDYLGYL